MDTRLPEDTGRWAPPRAGRHAAPWPLRERPREVEGPLDWTQTWQQLPLRALRGTPELNITEVLRGLHGGGDPEAARALLIVTQSQAESWGRAGARAPGPEAQLRLLAGLRLLQEGEVQPGAVLGLYLQAAPTFGPTLHDLSATLALDALSEDQPGDAQPLTPHLLHLSAVTLLLSTLREAQLPTLMRAFGRTEPQHRLWQTLVGRASGRLVPQLNLASAHPDQVMWRDHPALQSRRLNPGHLTALWPRSDAAQVSRPCPHPLGLRPATLHIWSRLSQGWTAHVTVRQLSTHACGGQPDLSEPDTLMSVAARTLITAQRLQVWTGARSAGRPVIVVQPLRPHASEHNWHLPPVCAAALSLMSVAEHLSRNQSQEEPMLQQAALMQRLIAEQAGVTESTLTKQATNLLNSAAHALNDPSRFTFMECFPSVDDGAPVTPQTVRARKLLGDLTDPAFVQWLADVTSGLHLLETWNSQRRINSLNELTDQFETASRRSRVITEDHP